MTSCDTNDGWLDLDAWFAEHGHPPEHLIRNAMHEMGLEEEPELPFEEAAPTVCEPCSSATVGA